MHNAKDKQTETSPTGAEMMKEILPDIKAMHDLAFDINLRRMQNSTKAQLIKEVISERKAKGQAEYFIIEKGLFDEFCNYCKKQKRK